MINERAIINVLIIGATLALLPFMVGSMLDVDYLPVLLLIAAFGVVVAFFFLKERLSMCPLLGLGTLGSLNFLPVPLRATHIAFLLLILYYISGYVAIRQKSVKLGRGILLLPIIVLTSIVLYHNPTVGLHVFGGKTEGGRPAVLLYLAVVGYFCAINMTPPSPTFLRRIPLYAVILTVVSSIPFVLTSFIPSLAPYVYYITDNVNVDAYLDTKAPSVSDSAEEGIGRLAILGSLGGVILNCILAYYPIGSWLRPNRWWVGILFLLALGCAIASGYRSTLTGFLFAMFVAAWCYYSWRSLFLPFFVAVFVLCFAVASANHLIDLPLDKLPLIAQRTLSFLPGDWSKDALESAKASNDFRKNIQDVYLREYFWKSPLFGNGFDIDTSEYERLNDAMLNRYSTDADYDQAKVFITGKLFHTGWLSVYDIVGGVGMVAFIFLGLAEIWLAGRLIFGRNAKRKSFLFPFYVWMTVSVTTTLFTFFTVFGDFAGAFTQFLIYGIALSQIYDLEASGKITEVSPARKNVSSFPALKGATVAS